MRVLITGAASGIGAAAAAALRRRGASVVGLDLNEGPGIVVADVRDQAQVDAAVERAVREMGGLDVVVNSAGIGEPQNAGLPPDDAAVAIMETNFFGPWRVTAAAMPALLRSRGRVVNVASGLAAISLPYGAAYSASKRALAAYSDVLRVEYGGRITVTTVYPGYVNTPIHRPSLARGVQLGRAVPQDSLDAAAGTVVRACLGPPRRELATSTLTATGVFIARHAPALVDAVVRARVRTMARRGQLGDAHLGSPAPDDR